MGWTLKHLFVPIFPSSTLPCFSFKITSFSDHDGDLNLNLDKVVELDQVLFQSQLAFFHLENFFITIIIIIFIIFNIIIIIIIFTARDQFSEALRLSARLTWEV